MNKFGVDHVCYFSMTIPLKSRFSSINNAILYVYKELTKLYQYEMIGKAADILNNLPNKIFGEYCIIIQNLHSIWIIFCFQKYSNKSITAIKIL